MTEQERFEELVSSEPFAYSTARSGNGYLSMATNELRAIWLAARADALEEAYGFEHETKEQI